MSIELEVLLPQSKSDLERARAIVAQGYPAVGPVLPQLFEWLQDCNWPVSRVITPFLASIGLPVVDEVRNILATTDNIWKYWVLTEVVSRASDVARALHLELTRLAWNPSQGEVWEEVHLAAREILAQLDNDDK